MKSLSVLRREYSVGQSHRDKIHVTGQMIGEHELEQIDKFLRDSMKEKIETDAGEGLADEGVK